MWDRGNDIGVGDTPPDVEHERLVGYLTPDPHIPKLRLA
jgi:hypothetical protein